MMALQSKPPSPNQTLPNQTLPNQTLPNLKKQQSYPLRRPS
jgi:hypothetical protein